MKKLIIALSIVSVLLSCTENYSSGYRIGYITKFSRKGIWFKTWEGDLNVTQTGNNSAGTAVWSFSLDENNINPVMVLAIDSAANNGYLVKVGYRQAAVGVNCSGARGESNYFVTSVQLLKR